MNESDSVSPREQALHKSLRAHAITDGLCYECDEVWEGSEGERHAPNCLAALVAQQPPLPRERALEEALRGVIAEADRDTDAFIRARALIAAQQPVADAPPLGAMNWGRLPTMADYDDPAPDAARQGLTPSVTMTVGVADGRADALLRRFGETSISTWQWTELMKDLTAYLAQHQNLTGHDE